MAFLYVEVLRSYPVFPRPDISALFVKKILQFSATFLHYVHMHTIERAAILFLYQKNLAKSQPHIPKEERYEHE